MVKLGIARPISILLNLTQVPGNDFSHIFFGGMHSKVTIAWLANAHRVMKVATMKDPILMNLTGKIRRYNSNTDILTMAIAGMNT